MYIAYGTEYETINDRTLNQNIEIMHSWVWLNVDNFKKDLKNLNWITSNEKDTIVIKGLIVHKAELPGLGVVTKKGYVFNDVSKKLIYEISSKFTNHFNWLGVDIEPNNLNNNRKVLVIYSDSNLVYTNCQRVVSIQLENFRRIMKPQMRIVK